MATKVNASSENKNIKYSQLIVRVKILSLSVLYSLLDERKSKIKKNHEELSEFARAQNASDVA